MLNVQTMTTTASDDLVTDKRFVTSIFPGSFAIITLFASILSLASLC